MSTRRRPSAPPISSGRSPSGRLATGEDEEIALTNEEIGEEADLSDERYEDLKAREQFVLTVTEYGYGKRSSSYDFRLTGPRRQGHPRHRRVEGRRDRPAGRGLPGRQRGPDHAGVGWRPVIRVPVNGIRIASRATKGVTIFNTAEGEKVVSVERISEPQGEEGEEAAPTDPSPDPAAGEQE